MTDKISKNRQKKEQIIAELTEKVSRAKGMVFTNYRGLTHKQIEGFRRNLSLREANGAEYVAAKNTLLLRALKEKIDTKNEKGHFTQPTATLFLYDDVIEPLKQLMKLIKELKMPGIKFAYLEGKTLTADEVAKISTLPPLLVLRAQLLGQMKAPISGLHRALNWNLQKLVLTLNAIKEKKTN